MKAGRVIYVRVNPKDCMSCIDVCHKVITITRGMSFAQLVSVALSTMLETMRHEGIIPIREGFEYSQMMAPWDADRKMTKTKFKLNKEIELQGSEFIAPALPIDKGEMSSPATRRLEKQIAELSARHQADPLNSKLEEILALNEQLANEYAKLQTK